jgi:glucosamine--fructose-6-phosphate aminotransferase (isomerizing)
LQYTKNYYLIKHDEIAKLTFEGVEFYDRHLNPIKKELQEADWDMESAEKGGYPHFMLKEINEQPDSIKRTIIPRINNGMPDLSECGITVDTLKEFKNIHIVACGTAMHAGMVGKYVIEELARIPVNVDIASEFRYRDPLIGEGDLVIIISQSGETADSKEAMYLAKRKGAKTLAIVNAKGSSIAREADMLIYTHAGPEIAVASTKAYMVQLAVMYLFAFELAYAKGAISEDECKALVADLKEVPEYVSKTLDMTVDACQYAGSSLITADSLLYIGRGLDYALSMEGSLKLKEISYIHSESYAAGELKHGTISLIDDGMPVIAVATQNRLIEKTVSNIKEVKARGAYTIFVCDESCTVESEVADEVIKVPKIRELLMPMIAVVPLQLVAYYTALAKGNDVDKPRNLAKSVTVE